MGGEWGGGGDRGKKGEGEVRFTVDAGGAVCCKQVSKMTWIVLELLLLRALRRRMACTCKLVYNGFADGLIGSGDYADESILLTAGKVLAYAIMQFLTLFAEYTSFPSAR